ncbi:helix-turn-helix domain-containing protein [Anaerovorax odorimutans]|uniref:Helix-turn-helix domain-containing protein n=1 Tax=Anaerovorax odorimutans TaxID=109327 RepID=A0ABT1RM85_9FIRM|nr:helix-turn-helix transcriptional regulator [Anaerovorax odorimutans]MCQ4636294.1 helix-turn-helix domain-containing protein [Anaerovorax odorimutans]
MKEINISKTLTQKRKEKGITQDELAAYIGVSKASVSKWETGQSYPDITFLPQLATYFNISIDDLLGYTPQMSKEEIRNLYHELADRFADSPFEETYDRCQKIIHKYYCCFPLLLQMAVLYLNHHMVAPKEQQSAVLDEALELCRRIKEESGNVFLSKDATMVEAAAYMMTNRPQEVLELFGETLRPITQETESMAQAYIMMGNPEKGREALQVSIYQHLIVLESSMAQLLTLPGQEPQKTDLILKRFLGIARLFELEKLHPNVMASSALAGAQFFCAMGEAEKALDFLDLYVTACENFAPFTLHGDVFFDSIDSWLADFDLGNQAPRSKDIIKKSLIESIEQNPALTPLKETPEFKTILIKLKSVLGGN